MQSIMFKKKVKKEKKRRIRNLIKKVFNRENMRNPLFWGGVVGVTSLIIALSVGMIAYTEQSSFCRTCHIMDEPWDVWAKSTHARVRCNVCHVHPGLWNALKHKPAGLLEVWAVITDNPSQPRNVHAPDNVNCEQCHKSKRKVSSTGDLLMPHEAHTKLRGLKCVDCHRDLVHTATGKKKNMPAMNVCYKCHDGKKAPNACSSCHTEKAVPEDHNQDDWLKVHSLKQKEDPEYCENCHGWVKDYCSECHQRKPSTHATKWRTNHKTRILADGKQGCNHCHNDDMCIRCHGLVP